MRIMLDKNTTINEKPYMGVYNFMTVLGFIKIYQSNQTIKNTATRLIRPKK
jgi:hypothetical protein